MEGVHELVGHRLELRRVRASDCNSTEHQRRNRDPREHVVAVDAWLASRSALRARQFFVCSFICYETSEYTVDNDCRLLHVNRHTAREGVAVLCNISEDRFGATGSSWGRETAARSSAHCGLVEQIRTRKTGGKENG